MAMLAHCRKWSSAYVAYDYLNLGAPPVWCCRRAPPLLHKRLASWCDVVFSDVYLKSSTELKGSLVNQTKTKSIEKIWKKEIEQDKTHKGNNEDRYLNDWLIYQTYVNAARVEHITALVWLTAHNWQNWKSRFPSCPCQWQEAVGLKKLNFTIFVNMETWGNFVKIWFFVNNCLIKVRI